MQCSRCGQTMTQGPGGWYICYGCGNSQPPLHVGRIGGTRGMPRLRRAAGAAPARVVGVRHPRLRVRAARRGGHAVPVAGR